MIGIMTFHRAINYGAVLQTYALQTMLNDLGIENEIIDYRSRTIEKLYYPFWPFLNSFKTASFIPKSLKKKRFDRFVHRNLHMSRGANNIEQLELICRNYSKIITGSDQVWCKKCALQEKAYFLDFIKDGSRKASYAASIGNADFNEDILKVYSDLLADYSAISVREESAKRMVETVSAGAEIQVNIDPTLLLDKSLWNKIRSRNLESGPYVLVYTVMGQYKLMDQAETFAKKKGLRVIYLNDEMIKRRKGICYRIAVSPEDFVGYFAEAEYVFTNSFHGTAFSIIFNKKFVVEIEAKGRRNIRSEELLDKLGLTDRFLSDNSCNDIENNINWDEVQVLLDAERQKSKDYLAKTCSR